MIVLNGCFLYQKLLKIQEDIKYLIAKLGSFGLDAYFKYSDFKFIIKKF